MILTAAVIAAFFAPWPWNLVLVCGGIVAEVGEIVWGRRLARRWRPQTGPEAMVGKRARVVTACRPVGSVRVHGELWQARCEAGADVGDRVRIERLDGLELVVAPLRKR